MDVFSFLSDLNFSTGQPELKNIFFSPNFNIVRIILPKGLEISPHPEPNAIFFLVIEGSGIFTIGNDTFEMNKHDSLFVKAGEIRGIKCLENLVLLGARDLDPML
ncbi:cupin domain-containing protein [Promethearchaeum syntrophicum]|uniref:Cupin domain-containing protein n=1 Tax=Promethearchaeum syntrophicum TaxID=2594042 RepID=A0A5B9DBH7_9ARCH|nr:cupin domain-containing protein [Candidatus Prometheoarchaeum syntrophicum]QEE16472.1 Cupin domain protein [Candidatus Prometheoarchaeum syntrophicum]